MTTTSTTERLRLTITGVVQGVGFRPFVHRLATELGLTGFVGNDARAVFAEIQGPGALLDEMARRLITDAPPLAVVMSVRAEKTAPRPEDGFRIVASRTGPGERILAPPDVATCDACLRELFDPGNRRYRHPFITCTDCGPRFTIIRDLPYDRPATTMAGFAMCDQCAAEYEDPSDRRFHAQPVSCHGCGPKLRFEHDAQRVTGTDEVIAGAQQVLAAGGIVAVKGIGGYHLACRADCPAAVARLRERKARDGKPFAVLTRNMTTARALADIGPAECRVLASPARPIVLVRRRDGAPVAENVAPGNPLLGVLLPYSPVHHLLLSQVPGGRQPFPHTLVMTSANVSDEPLCFDDADAAGRLPRLADAVLTHDRPIHVPCDDSVVRVAGDGELPVRRSRGYAPLPVPVGRALPPVLAVGGELKNSCCLTVGDRAFCSAHIGDMGRLETLQAFERSVVQLTTMHAAAPAIIAADAHPGYLTREWAERRAGRPGEPALRLVQHHHAHVASLLAEHGRLGEPLIGFAFDGTGYGQDGTVWGGEVLLVGADADRFERAGHLAPVTLAGGDSAVRNPCRAALAYLAAAGLDWDARLPAVAACDDSERAVTAAQLASGSGTVSCTSMGRLFDAVAALLGVRQRISYEAQAAIELEILAEQAADADAGRLDMRLPVADDCVIDWRPAVRALVAESLAGVPATVLARGFHLAVAQAVAETADWIARGRGIRTAGLTGGVFQNMLLTHVCRQRLEERGFEVLTHRLVPPNDGGLAIGQAVIAGLGAGRS